MATTTVSYRRNRDYSKQFNWSYELNKDLFECYIEAKDQPGRGYMKRMKNMWDNLHPEFSYFTEKYLRQQALYITQKSYIRETQTVANNNENITDQNNSPERPIRFEQHSEIDNDINDESVPLGDNDPEQNDNNYEIKRYNI